MKRLIYSLSFLIIARVSINSNVMSQVKQKPVLNHIALYVFDRKKSTEFYRDVLQLDVIPEPFKDGKHTWFKLGEYSQLHLIEGAKQFSLTRKAHIYASV